MKALFIGGTGTISTAVTRLASSLGWEIYVLNRGNRNSSLPGNVRMITCDISDEEQVRTAISGMSFDVVADFICYTLPQAERDHRLFRDKTSQFIFISSASAYLKPPAGYPITESAPLRNPYWQYSRDKIACEEYFMSLFRNEGFPVTIVRPSHTYCSNSIPVGLHGENGSWQIAARILSGRKVLIHGDGTSLWTMTDSRDLAKGFVGLMGNIHAVGEAVHITSDEALSWNQIYTCLADALGKKFEPFHVSSDFLSSVCYYDIKGTLLGDKSHCAIFDNTKIKRLVSGFSADIRFDEGIRNTVGYILSHPEYQTEDPEFDAWCDRVIDAVSKSAADIC